MEPQDSADACWSMVGPASEGPGLPHWIQGRESEQSELRLGQGEQNSRRGHGTWQSMHTSEPGSCQNWLLFFFPMWLSVRGVCQHSRNRSEQISCV